MKAGIEGELRLSKIMVAGYIAGTKVPVTV